MLRIMHTRVSTLALLALGTSAAAMSTAQEPAAQPLHGLRQAWWNEQSAEIWMLCEEEGQARVRVFDPWLREREEREAQAMPPGAVPARADGSCELPLWGGRHLRADADGRLRLMPAWWETAPRVFWGPGWVVIELRNGRPLAPLLWRRVGDAELHVAAFAAERFDGARQRAQFFGPGAGERIEIALPELLPSYPPRGEPEWRSFTVPVVDPEGARPTSEWPSE